MKFDNLKEHGYRLKTQLGLAAIAWLLLMFEYPVGEGIVPQWWTMVYALAKFTIATSVSYIFIHETFPSLRVTEAYKNYNIDRLSSTGNAVASAIVLCGLLVFRAIIMGVSIYVLTIW